MTAYANECGVSQLIHPGTKSFSLEVQFVEAFPDAECNTLYVINGMNYGIFATFTTVNPFIIQFDPVNNQTYALFYFSNFVAALKIPRYNATFLLP